MGSGVRRRVAKTQWRPRGRTRTARVAVRRERGPLLPRSSWPRDRTETTPTTETTSTRCHRAPPPAAAGPRRASVPTPRDRRPRRRARQRAQCWGGEGRQRSQRRLRAKRAPRSPRRTAPRTRDRANRCDARRSTVRDCDRGRSGPGGDGRRNRDRLPRRCDRYDGSHSRLRGSGLNVRARSLAEGNSECEDGAEGRRHQERPHERTPPARATRRGRSSRHGR